MNFKSASVFLVFLSIIVVSSGCSQNTETNSIENKNSTITKQSPNANGFSVNSAAANTENLNAAVSSVNQQTANKKQMPPASEPKPQIGSGGSDLSTLVEARGKLSADKDLIKSVIVEVKEGVVTLSGTVSSEEQKRKAEDIVKGVQGAKSVKNNLRVL